MIKVKQKVEIVRGNAGRKQIATAPVARPAAPDGRIPRISKLMALAIRFDGLLRSDVGAGALAQRGAIDVTQALYRTDYSITQRRSSDR